MTIDYEHGRPRAVRTIVVAAQHDEEVATDRLRDDIIELVINPVVPRSLRRVDPTIHVNPTGRFVIGGPMGDAGLTGRKIIVDTYGGMARHGGGAFSGKDPSKVDRSAAYAARWVAKNIVAAGIADRFEVEVAYAIGVARPLSISIETFGTGKIPDERILGLIDHHFDLRPRAIIEQPRPAPARSTARPPPTATSAGPTWTSPGSAPTWRPPWPTTPGQGPRAGGRRLSLSAAAGPESAAADPGSGHVRRDPGRRGRHAAVAAEHARTGPSRSCPCWPMGRASSSARSPARRA